MDTQLKRGGIVTAWSVLLSLVAGLFQAMGAHASPITIGSLSYDAAADPTVIVDSQNNRHWLRFDQLAGMKHADVLALFQTSAYQGWHIANHEDTHLFTNALEPAGVVNTCNDASVDGTCWLDYDNAYLYHQLLGESATPGDVYDTAMFYSATPGYIGFVQGGRKFSATWVTRKQKLTVFNNADQYALQYNLSWLAYKELPITTPPVPPTSASAPSGLLSLFAPCVALLLIRRRQKQQ